MSLFVKIFNLIKMDENQTSGKKIINCYLLASSFYIENNYLY